MFGIISSAIALLITYWPPLLLAGLLSYFTSLFLRKEDKNLPPGPRGWPIVGYIPYLDDFAHLQFIELTKNYGKVFRVRLGLNDCVILNDNASACEALNKDACANCPQPNIFNLFGAERGLTNWNDDIWKDHRRFTLRALRTVGVGKSKMENLISEEIEYLTKQLESHNGEPIRVRNYLQPSASNVVLAVLLGERFDYDHPTRKMLDKSLDFEQDSSLPFTGYFCNFVEIGRLVQYLPFTSAFNLKERSKQFNNFFRGVTGEHLKTIDKDNPRDLMDYYFNDCDDKKSPHFSSKPLC